MTGPYISTHMHPDQHDTKYGFEGNGNDNDDGSVRCGDDIICSILLLLFRHSPSLAAPC